MREKEPETEKEFIHAVQLKEVTNKGLQRLLLQAWRDSNNRSLPMHKRSKDEPEDMDDDTREAAKENDKLVDLHAEKGSPAPIPATDEDFPETVAEKLPKAKAKTKKA